MSTPARTPALPDLHRIGICIEDPTSQRLLESAAVHLELDPVLLKRDQLPETDFRGFELVLAEEEDALSIVKLLSASDDPARPAVLLITSPEISLEDQMANHSFDGILPMPQLLGPLAAQLSVALYSHRAFSRRHEDAYEELQLNRRIFRSVSNGISISKVTDEDLPLSYVNPSFEAMTGYKFEEVVGRNCRFLQADDRDQPALTLVREAIAEGRSTVATLKNFRKDGTPFWNELALSPIHNRDGKLTHFVGVQTDVTARVEFETALRESEKLAVVGRLSAVIAHEINSPLEALMNLVYIAQRSTTLEDAKPFIDMMDGELRRLKLIASQSLRFARQSTQPQVVQCNELLDSILDLQQARITGAGLSVQRRDRFNDSIICMESEIRQVLNNLIANATDAMRGSNGQLLVRTRQATDWATNREGVIITVADSGHGISEESRKRLFQPFFSTKGQQGTGLGLWISRGIVDRHHGRLSLRSSQTGAHTGTVFTLFLPYQGVASTAT